MTKTIYLILASLMMALSSLSTAFPIDTYAGIGSGYSWTDAALNEKSVTELGSTRTPTYTDIEEEGIPWTIYAGFRFHPNYGIEVAYLQFAELQFEKTTEQFDISTARFVQGDRREARIQASGFSLQHVLYLRLPFQLNLAAKAGVFLGNAKLVDTLIFIENRTDSEDNSTTIVEIPSGTERSTKSISNLHFGVSADWRYIKDWTVRWQLEQVQYKYNAESEEYTQWLSSLSFQRHF